MQGKYIDPLIDFSFKKIFGSESNKDLLIDLLNQIFRGKKQIVDLTLNKNENHGDIDDIGGVTFDLTCTGHDGEIFLIEVQRSNQIRLKQRMLCYGSRLISDMVPKGERENWSYNISEVYVIVLLDGFTLLDSPPDNYLHDVCLCYQDTGKVFYEGYDYIFIELLKFVKTESELNTGLDCWLYALKHTSSRDDISNILNRPVFEKFFNIAEYSKLTKEEKVMYDTYLKRKWDYDNALEFAREDGLEKGVEEGMKQGMKQGMKRGIKEGIKEGIVKGREEGMTKGKWEVVVNMLLKGGFSDEEIAGLTNTSVEFVAKVKSEINKSN